MAALKLHALELALGFGFMFDFRRQMRAGLDSRSPVERCIVILDRC